VINWRKIHSSTAFLAGMVAGGIICRNGWDAVNWAAIGWSVALGIGLAILIRVARPWWEHRAEWSEIIWGRRR
jgi:hypothetical protein